MRTRLEVQQRTDTPDARGQAIPAWATVTSVWAAIRPLSGRMLWHAQQAQADVSHTIIIRHFPGLVPERFRFKRGATIFNIVAVMNTNDRSIWNECQCKERVV